MDVYAWGERRHHHYGRGSMGSTSQYRRLQNPPPPEARNEHSRDSLSLEEARVGTTKSATKDSGSRASSMSIWNQHDPQLPGILPSSSGRRSRENRVLSQGKQRTYDVGDGVALNYGGSHSKLNGSAVGNQGRPRTYNNHGYCEQDSQREKGRTASRSKLRRDFGERDSPVDGPVSAGGTQSSARSSISRHRSSPRGLVGLVNMGNTCFMNSCIQCLANIPPLVHFFLDNSWRKALNVKSETKGRVATALGDLLQRLWKEGSSGSSERPSEIKRLVGRISPRFAGFDQQDAQEFLRFLLDALNDDLNRVRSKIPYKELDESPDQSDREVSEEWWDYHCKRNNSIVNDLFGGQLKSEVKCLSCGAVSRCFDPFLDLSLQIPQSVQAAGRRSSGRFGSNRNISIHNCLKSYIGPERISAEGYICKRCKRETSCEKYLTIFKSPEILVFHLKRFTFSTFRRSKITASIDFPTLQLDISPYISKNSHEWNVPPVYDLVAVSNHMGTLNGGHYTADARNMDTGEWYNFNDTKVSPISPEQISGSNAYILFYVKRNKA
eukprot:gb/GECG01000416.1/.p1 GENE.gb/GECG01000416.1/~~gb/GECG01000416.1/.p1  ORF type:complete len:552 (+),score=58.79 gb/GECG01000416.1/:1-1656(+)